VGEGRGEWDKEWGILGGYEVDVYFCEPHGDGSRTLEQAEKASSASGDGPVLGWVFGFMVPMVLLGSVI
jgi:hypothetical protein